MKSNVSKVITLGKIETSIFCEECSILTGHSVVSQLVEVRGVWRLKVSDLCRKCGTSKCEAFILSKDEDNFI